MADENPYAKSIGGIFILFFEKKRELIKVE